ncbi:protein FAR1-RELATED SEQUENCE 5-like [Telopea speciosissima]|uniref:protein FAR1-RELATED SEQUENCE 5-like n=1 Tax=Telopea speciosissima TaxID=54955 RepID=UPI001CC62141|nr:protein FAR1-RELATED SEQUENCE 5-like [Telopea speciosissima]
MNLMSSTLGEGFGFIESEKGSNSRNFDEHETKEDELLEFCDSQVDGNNEMTLKEMSREELTPNDEPLEPYTGMSFNSVDDAREFYSAYAKHIGFTVRTNRIRHSQKNRTIIARDYVCSREGFRAAKHTLRKDRILPPRPITREGCKAMIRVAARDGSKWVVTKFVPEHNHNLMTQSKEPGQRPSLSEVSLRSAIIDDCSY